MPYEFDSDLSVMNPGGLRNLAGALAGKAILQETDRVGAVLAALDDPLAVQRAVSRLQPHEKQMLRLLGFAGGKASMVTLALGALAYGLEIPNFAGLKALGAMASPLVRKGLACTAGQAIPGYMSTIFTDHRITDALSDVSLPQLPVTGVQRDLAAVWRRPAAVSLDLIRVAAHFQSFKALGITQSGAFKVNDIRKLSGPLGWIGPAPFDGLLFPEATEMLVWALEAMGLLSRAGSYLESGEGFQSIAATDHVRLIRILTRAFMDLSDWQDARLRSWRFTRVDGAGSQIQAAFVLLLRGLPCRNGMHCPLPELSSLLRSRVSHCCTASPQLALKPPFLQTPQTDAEWSEFHEPRLLAGLSTWMYALGLVELGMHDGVPVSFGLTDLGEQALLGDGAPTAASPPASDPEPQAPWAVLPSFELIVYLASAGLRDLRFLEYHADRLDVQEHTARYRLTKLSVYGGLQLGTPPAAFLKALRDGSRHDLPPNVLAEVKEWTETFGRVRLRDESILLWPSGEAPRPLTRFEFEATLVKGVSKPDIRVVDRPSPTLSIDEDGVVRCMYAMHDPLLLTVLNAWAEREGSAGWKLTEQSVSRGKAKGSAEGLLAFLSHHCTQPIPPVITLAVRCWAGDARRVRTSRAIVLICPSRADFLAITESPRFRPYVRDSAGDRIVIVDEDKLAGLRKELEWAGIEASCL